MALIALIIAFSIILVIAPSVTQKVIEVSKTKENIIAFIMVAAAITMDFLLAAAIIKFASWAVGFVFTWKSAFGLWAIIIMDSII